MQEKRGKRRHGQEHEVPEQEPPQGFFLHHGETDPAAREN